MDEGAEALLARAEADRRAEDGNAPAAPRRAGTGKRVDPGQAEADRRGRRYIYNGETRKADPPVPARSNRRVVRRRLSTSSIMLVLLGIGIASVVYINNIIAVNRLAHEVNQLQQAYDRLQSANAALRADVNRKSAMERIGAVASRELGLRPPAEKPAEFPIDEDALDDLKARQSP
jgi:cell division protein FtsL